MDGMPSTENHYLLCNCDGHRERLKAIMLKVKIGFLIGIPILKIAFNCILFLFVFDGREKIGDIENQMLQAPCNVSDLMPWNEFYNLYENCTFINKEINYTKEISHFHKNESDLNFYLKYVTADLKSIRNKMKLAMELQKEMREPCINKAAKEVILPSLKQYYLIAWIMVGISVLLIGVMAVLIWKLKEHILQYLLYFIAFCWILYATLIWCHISTLNAVSEKIEFLMNFNIDDVVPKC
uniref:Uncharacterized protein n=1 Tax=Panagrolaimus davidi TaxID=227884 RepID=A0A914QME2_9BILA